METLKCYVILMYIITIPFLNVKKRFLLQKFTTSLWKFMERLLLVNWMGTFWGHHSRNSSILVVCVGETWSAFITLKF